MSRLRSTPQGQYYEMTPNIVSGKVVVPDNLNYKAQLVQYGIHVDLIPQHLTDEQCRLLYKKLKGFPPCWIQQSWQLLAILGEETAFDNLDQKDLAGVNMADYAALSGNIALLNRVKAKRPALFSQWGGWTDVVHYGVRSGNPDVLQWIKDNQSDALDQIDIDGRTIAHHAARRGDVNALQWIKDNKPDLLEQIDITGWTIAHFAAESGNTELLRWVKKNRFHLLHVTNHYGQSIVFNTLFSGHEEQFNLALSLSGNPQEVRIKLNDKLLEKYAFPILFKALKTNYSLIEVTGLPQIESPELKRLSDYLKDNQRIQMELKEITLKFTLMSLGHSEENSCFPSDIWLNLFVHAVKAISERIGEKDIHALFHKIKNESRVLNNNNEAKQRRENALWAVKTEIIRLKSKDLPGTGLFSTGERSQTPQIRALAVLKELIVEGDEFTEEKFNSWYLTYSKMINRQPHFPPLVIKLCEYFGFDEKRVTGSRDAEGHLQANEEHPPAPQR